MEKLIHSSWGKALFFALLTAVSLTSRAGEQLSRDQVGFFLAMIIPEHLKSRVDQRDMTSVLKSVAIKESGNDPTLRSDAGAEGLFQLMPFVWESKNVDDPKDPYQNTRAAVDHWMDYFKMCRQDVILTLAAWNAGPANVFDQLELLEIEAEARGSIWQKLIRNSPGQPDPEKIKTDCTPSPWDGRIRLRELQNTCRERFLCFGPTPNGNLLSSGGSCRDIKGSLSEYYFKKLRMDRVPNFRETRDFVLRVVEDYCQNMTHPSSGMSAANQKLQGSENFSSSDANVTQ